MVADIHTKAFPVKEAWEHAHKLCGIFDPKELDERVMAHAQGYNVSDDAMKPKGNRSTSHDVGAPLVAMLRAQKTKLL